MIHILWKLGLPFVYSKLVPTRIASLGFQAGAICTFCKTTPACIWCSDSDPLAFFSEVCWYVCTYALCMHT